MNPTAVDEVVGICRDLLRIDTTNTGDPDTTVGERVAAEYVADQLAEVGIEWSFTALEALDEAAVSHQIVLTKTDQITAKELEDRLARVAAISRRAAAFPDILVTSALKGQGIDELRAAIARLVAERR